MRLYDKWTQWLKQTTKIDNSTLELETIMNANPAEDVESLLGTFVLLNIGCGVYFVYITSIVFFNDHYHIYGQVKSSLDLPDDDFQQVQKSIIKVKSLSELQSIDPTCYIGY